MKATLLSLTEFEYHLENHAFAKRIFEFQQILKKNHFLYNIFVAHAKVSENNFS